MISTSSRPEKDLDGHPDEQIERLPTYDRSSPPSKISEAHRDYLIKQHGILTLDPIPDFTDADPLNWSTAKVSHSTTTITQLTFHRKQSISSS